MRTELKLRPLLIGLLLALALYITPNPTTMSLGGWHTLSIAALMIVYWVTEALPIAITALIPLIYLPLNHLLPASALANAYGNRIIFLFLGGFLLATALQKSQLHKRLAITLIERIGRTPHRLLLAFLLVSSFLSMWISNTATTIMLLPIAQSALDLYHDDQRNALAKPLLLTTAYAASIGGMATLIGTPPNALLAGYLLENHQYSLDFASWFFIAAPLVLLALPLLYLVVTRFCFQLPPPSEQGISSALSSAKQSIPKKCRPIEKRVATIFGLTVIGWFSRHWLGRYIPGLNDTSIALFFAALLFVLPQDKQQKPILQISDFRHIAWSVLILLGGGLALAAAITHNGVDLWFASRLHFLANLPHFAVLLILVFTVILVTEMMSNTATTATFLPIVAAVAAAINIAPMQLLIPITLAASCAFMLPAATAPNAIIYADSSLQIKDMLRAGWRLNVVMGILISIYCYCYPL